jgi:hypothetical protein
MGENGKMGADRLFAGGVAARLGVGLAAAAAFVALAVFGWR